TDFHKKTSTVVREAVIKGKRYKAFVHGPRAYQPSQQNVPQHGIAIDEKLAVANETVRVLEPAEAAALEAESGVAPEQNCGVSGLPSNYRNQQVAGEIGGEVRYFCGVDHIKLLNQHPVAASGGIGGSGNLPSAADNNWTHGLKTVLYMRVNF